MSKKQIGKREIVQLDEISIRADASGTPASKRSRSIRSTSKRPIPDSSRSDESRARTDRGVIASAAGVSEPRRASGEASRTPAAERSSGVESVTSSMPLVERPSGEADLATSSMLPTERPSERYSLQTLRPIQIQCISSC